MPRAQVCFGRPVDTVGGIRGNWPPNLFCFTLKYVSQQNLATKETFH